MCFITAVHSGSEQGELQLHIRAQVPMGSSTQKGTWAWKSCPGWAGSVLLVQREDWDGKESTEETLGSSSPEVFQN